MDVRLVILEPQAILATAEKAGMFPEQAQTPLGKISTPKVKNQLKETTHSAWEHGAFGLPVTLAPLDGQTHLLVGSGVVGTPSGREGGGPCASSHTYQTLGMARGEQNY